MVLANRKAIALGLILALCLSLGVAVSHDHGAHEHGGTLCAVCVTIATGVLAIAAAAILVTANSVTTPNVVARVFAPNSPRLLSNRAQRAPPSL